MKLEMTKVVQPPVFQTETGLSLPHVLRTMYVCTANDVEIRTVVTRCWNRSASPLRNNRYLPSANSYLDWAYRPCDSFEGM